MAPPPISCHDFGSMKGKGSVPGRLRIPLLAMVLLVAAAACGVSAAATGLFDSGPNDLVTTVVHQLTGGVNIAAAPVQQHPEPPLTAVPNPGCGPGSHPDPAGPDGRVPQSVIPAAEQSGFTCNLSLVAHQGHSGGFKVWRYFDPAGHECAYYDTALLYPLNALRLDGSSQGVAVIDMSNPAHPVQTDTLTSLPMLSPHESLNLDPHRGLLAADLGNPATYPGLVSIYDIRHDCRHPVLDATGQYARWGHESGFSPNGTFWATGTGVPALAAIDTTDPHHPKTVWDGNVYVHGLNISADGNRAYLADATEKKLIILDTSQIQQHKAEPAGARDLGAHLAGSVDPAERDPVHLPRASVPARVRRIRDRHLSGCERGARRGSDHRHRRRHPPARRLGHPPPDPAAGRACRRRQRSGRVQSGAGLRRPLLQHPHPRRPGDRRLLDDRLGPAGVQHPGPPAPARDRLLRRSADAAGRERVHGQRLRHVPSGVLT